MPSEKPSAKGHISLKIGIAAAAGLLAWILIAPMKERELRVMNLHLTRMKIKTLLELENRYFFAKAAYTSDFSELKKLMPGVPDSVFRPVWTAYQRVDRSLFQSMSFDEFKRTYGDSLIVSPMTGERIILEIATKNGRPTFNIKPSAQGEDLKTIGGVIDGGITWDDKAEAAL